MQRGAAAVRVLLLSQRNSPARSGGSADHAPELDTCHISWLMNTFGLLNEERAICLWGGFLGEMPRKGRKLSAIMLIRDTHEQHWGVAAAMLETVVASLPRVLAAAGLAGPSLITSFHLYAIHWTSALSA